MTNEPAIEARRLSRRFGHRVAVANVDFKVRAGEFVTVFGPNGAGKTTLLRLLCGLLRPSAGEVLLLGSSFGKDPREAKRRLGYIGHASFLYPGLSARENLAFYARLYGLRNPGGRIEELLGQVDLVDRGGDPVRAYSRGMLQRLTIARALLHDPELVFLDEPYTGLDRRASRALTGLLSVCRERGRTVLMVTHNVEQGLELASRIVLIDRGRIVDDRAAEETDRLSIDNLFAEKVPGWTS